MSRNGSGTYSLPAGNPVVSGTTITTTWANNTLTDIANTLTASVASDGQTPMTGALNMGSNKITAVTDPTNAQDAATKSYTDTAITTATSGLGATYLAKANNLSDVTSASTSRTNLGLGTIATQAASAVAVTGGAINGTTVGTTTPASVKTSALTVTGATSGTLALAATAVAGTNTATFPAVTGTVMVSANMPTFSAYQSSAQTLATATATKLQFQTEEWDTANCFDNATNYRFTPNVDGYYQVTGELAPNSDCGMFLFLYKNGTVWKRWNNFASTTNTTGINGTALVYLNGSTDYIELYGWVSTGQALDARSFSTYFQAAMIRSA